MDKITEKNNRGRISLFMSIVLFAGLIVLYILYFTNDRDDEKQESHLRTEHPGGDDESRPLKVAFVNSDKVLNKYELVKKLSQELAAEEKLRENQLMQRQKAYEKDASYFQDQVASNTISEESAQSIYEQLMIEQQNIMDLSDQLAAELAEKEFEMNGILLDSVANYLERLNKKYNYDYILSYNRGGSILLAKDTFDLTDQVIEGLNSEYREKYKKKK